MDTARDIRTLDLVECEELWTMETVDRNGFICRGCTTQVFPASFDKEHNKKRPYFTLGPSKKHQAGCDIDGEDKIIKRAKKERVGTPEGFPLPFPSKLILTDKRPVEAKDLVTQGLSGSTRASSTSEKNTATPRKYHGHSVKSIRPACRAFIQLPNDRDFLPLEIPGVAGNTYAKIFTYLGSKKPEPFKFPTRLYYAAIRWTARPLITEEYCELTLNAGEWSQETGGYKTLCKVRVNWASWSKVRRNTLLREFTTTREEAIEQAKQNKQIKGWIFFVGTQDPADPSIFHMDNYQLICCLSAELIWPSKK